MKLLQHYHITLQTPVGTTRHPVTQLDHTKDRFALLTLQDGISKIDVQQTYPATFEAQDWSLEGEFRVYEHLENGARSVIIGMFQRR
jgi:hypothetical protein